MGLLDTLLRTEWDDRKDAGLFRYDVAACPSLMVPGAYGFIAQLNEGRASKKRPTEFRVDQVSVSCLHVWRCFRPAFSWRCISSITITLRAIVVPCV